MSTRRSKRLSRPEGVRIFGRDFILHWGTPDQTLGTDSLGRCYAPKQLISVDGTQLPIEEADTVLHEVIHAMDYIIGLNLEEDQVRHLASGLIGVFQDNPEFAKWLTRQMN